MGSEFGLLALLPPLVAIILCFATKQVLLSLFAGIYVGAVVISGWNPIKGVMYALDTIAFNLGDNTQLLLFTFFMGVGIAFIWRLGGSFALAEKAKKTFKKRRSVCLATWGLGMGTSINDCLVAAVDGNVFRDICKEYRISSEKFSFVLDATAAPSAALFISDWIAYQIGMIGQGLDIAGITELQPVAAYIKGIPFNFYSILMLIFVGILMYRGKDYGPMLKAEVRALTTGKFTRDGAAPMLDVDNELGEPKKTKPMIMTFVLPILSALVVIIGGIFWTGREGSGIMGILESCDATSALLWGSFTMAVVGIVLALATGIMNFKETMDTMVDGFKLMTMTGCILVLAWSVGAITKEMGLASFIITLIGDNIPFGVLPILILSLSILVAFSTGTSWGTMAIMTPLAIPLGYALTNDVNVAVAMAGVVLTGAILGDHASPVSDTTVMASIFSGADHIDHVKTQLPYALTVGAVAGVLFTIYGFFRVSPFILLPIGVVMLFFLQDILHKISLKRYNIDPSYTKYMTQDFSATADK